MVTIQRLILSLLLAGLTAGPALAASLPVSPGAHLTAAAPASSAIRSVLRLLVGVAALGASIKMRDMGFLANKFATRAGAASGDYKTGVETAGSDWEQNASAAEDNYKQGVNDSMSRNAFSKGVRRAGAAKYVKNATTLGPQRYQQGVANAKDAWAQGFAPVAQALQSLVLPPKGPKRSPANQNRSNMVQTALGAWKTAQ